VPPAAASTPNEPPIGLFGDIPEKDSATERNIFAGSAAYRNWAIKIPQQDYVGADQGKVQTKTAPARGWQRRGF